MTPATFREIGMVNLRPNEAAVLTEIACFKLREPGYNPLVPICLLLRRTVRQVFSMSIRQEKAQRKTELARQIREDCRAGRLAAGALLPSVRELALQHGLSKRVVNEELQKLVDEGWLRSVPRVGTFVRDAPQRAAVGGHFLHDSVLVLSPGNGQPPAGQHRTGWLSYVAVGAMRAIEDQGLHAVFLNPSRLCGEVIERLILDAPMGVLIPETSANVELVRAYGIALSRGGIPVVFNTGDPELAGHDRVASDAEAGGYALTRWLLARGRRHIRVFWEAGTDTYWSRERRAGYRRAMEEAGLEPLPEVEVPAGTAAPELPPAQVAGTARILARLRASGQPLDGIMAASDGPAVVMNAACRQLGLTPGQDVDITGYDNYWADLELLGLPSARPQATVDRCNEEIGAEMVGLLLTRVQQSTRRGANGPELRRLVPRLVDTSQPGVPVSLKLA